MKKRILMLLSVVALMVVMLAMSVTPAFARWVTEPGFSQGCKEGDVLTLANLFPQGARQDGKRTADGFVCQGSKQQIGAFKFYDNRPSPTL